MKKINLILLFIAVIVNTYAQSKVVLESSSNDDCIIFEVKEKSIKSKKYELKDFDNPEYVYLQKKIDSLNNLLKNPLYPILSKTTYDDLIKAKDYLYQAKHVTAEEDIPFLSPKKKYLTSAKELFEKTKIPFEQDVKGRKSMEQAKANMRKIDSIIDASKKEKSNIQYKINRLVNKIGKNCIGCESIPSKITKNVPVQDITRDILYIDTTSNIIANITGHEFSQVLIRDIFQMDKNQHSEFYLMKEDYFQYVKNEFVNKNDIESEIKDPTLLNGLTSMYRELYKDSESGRIYVMFNSCILTDKLEYDALAFLSASGGKHYFEDETWWVELNDSKCMFTYTIKKALANKNSSIIKQMEASVLEHKRLKDQANMLAIEMGKYVNKYKSKLITSEDVEVWKRVTLKCGTLIDQMKSLPFNDGPEYHRQIRRENENGMFFGDIIDFYLGSKTLLGL